ncbi:hypothetical protein EYF80_038902 [Liparis tanakae]|uniref:Uncharacterized protein n=1 Tax=Liparis tanakae TaxID=230148 RepID=A0A4Z2GB98_9TELE|nr:hypothetical protein EYF80_038902 [Liparis tanakae]
MESLDSPGWTLIDRHSFHDSSTANARVIDIRLASSKGTANAPVRTLPALRRHTENSLLFHL